MRRKKAIVRSRPEDFGTRQEVTWCPGCTNFSLLAAVKKVFASVVNTGVKHEDIVVVTGIGCHGKIFDYLNVSGFYGLHGRVLPAAVGIKFANPNLRVIGFSGDGDALAEGIEHFVHACRFNPDITLVLHDNQVFALTTGQNTPTTESTRRSKAMPFQHIKPLNPVKLALVSGASFVARTYALDIDYTAKILEQAIKHKGFAFVDVLQPCIAFHDSRSFVEKHSYKLETTGYKPNSLKKALEKAEEWNYELYEKAKIPLGVFYKTTRTTLEEQFPQLQKLMKQGKGWWQIKRKKQKFDFD